jgi:hypothetical protein
MRADRRSPQRDEVIARARRWRAARNARLWSTVDVAEHLGVPIERACAILGGSSIVLPTDGEVAALDDLFGPARSPDDDVANDP